MGERRFTILYKASERHHNWFGYEVWRGLPPLIFTTVRDKTGARARRAKTDLIYIWVPAKICRRLARIGENPAILLRVRRNNVALHATCFFAAPESATRDLVTAAKALNKHKPLAELAAHSRP